MPTSTELELAGWHLNARNCWEPPTPLVVNVGGRDRELHLHGDGVCLVDEGGGSTLERPQALRLLCKAAGGSPIERTFAAAWFMRHGHLPRAQVSIQRHNGSHYRADFLLPSNLIVELDGHNWHSNQYQRTRDAKRDRELMALGYRVIRFTGSEIHANADACVAEATALCQ